MIWDWNTARPFDTSRGLYFPVLKEHLTKKMDELIWREARDTRIRGQKETQRFIVQSALRHLWDSRMWYRNTAQRSTAELVKKFVVTVFWIVFQMDLSSVLTATSNLMTERLHSKFNPFLSIVIEWVKAYVQECG